MDGQAGWTAQQGMTQDQLQQMYNRPAAGPADTGRMTYDDVIVKTAACLGAVRRRRRRHPVRQHGPGLAC